MKVTKAGVIITNKNYTKIVCVMNHVTESLCEYKYGGCLRDIKNHMKQT
jgi:hypothetical protein